MLHGDNVVVDNFLAIDQIIKWPSVNWLLRTRLDRLNIDPATMSVGAARAHTALFVVALIVAVIVVFSSAAFVGILFGGGA